MAKTIRKKWIILVVLIFLLYVFIAAKPIPGETILAPRWLTSLESSFSVSMADNGIESAAESGTVIPFNYGNRFGYIKDNGQLLLNRIRKDGYLSFSPYLWSEYETVPSVLNIYNPAEELAMTINNPRGYPFFTDNRTYIVGSEQNSVSRIDNRGNEIWNYVFPAPLTCVDASSGYLLAGMLDGAIELLNESGRQIFAFEPGGSRLAVIPGCAISGDGSRLAVISGIDEQRFLMLEKTGETYRVMYHEFISTGFRRAVHIDFIDNDRNIVYERENGIGVYDIVSRTGFAIPLEGEIIAMDSADSKYFFVITSDGNRKRLTAILLKDGKQPPEIVLNAPFRSTNAYLARRDSRIYVGGDQSLISFELVKNK